VNPLEDLDEDEKFAVLTDIINADPVQNELNITEQRWSEVHSLFGGKKNETIQSYPCQRYRVTVQAQMAMQKKRIKTVDDFMHFASSKSNQSGYLKYFNENLA